jgi:hypothetical protein
MSYMSRSLAENSRMLKSDAFVYAIFSGRRLPPHLARGDMTPHLKIRRSHVRLMTYRLETAGTNPRRRRLCVKQKQALVIEAILVTSQWGTVQAGRQLLPLNHMAGLSQNPHKSISPGM